MAIVKQSYTGNGVQTLYTFSFPYLDPDHVLVTIDEVPTSAWSFANDNTVEFNAAPSNGAAILIYRETDSTAVAATLTPGGPVPAAQINENFQQTLFLSQESDDTAATAVSEAEAAASVAAASAAQAATASADAAAAAADAAASVATANAAAATAATALSTANTASTNASTAITTANGAVTTANSASTAASDAVTTANSAVTTANSAVTTANTASTNASNAVTTANTASTNATTAINTANSAVTTANSAVTTANTANSTANAANVTATDAEAIALVAQADAAAAVAAVASAVAYTPVADLTALGALTPSNGDFFELLDSTGAESSLLIQGVPGGLVGDSDLVFRLRYDSPPGKFTFLNYFASDPLSRFADISTETVAASAQTTANAALPKAGGTMTGNITFNGAQTFPVGGIQDGTTTQKGVVQLTNSVASTSTTTAAVPASVKSAYDLADTANTTANTANTTANAALPKAGGTMTGNITFNGAQTFPVGGIQDGTTSQKGVVQLSDSVASTSTTLAATANAAKTANDNANTRALKSGDTFTGSVTFANGSAATPGVRWNTNYGFYYDSGTAEVRLSMAGTDRIAFYPTSEIYHNQRNDGGEQVYQTIYRNASYQGEWFTTTTGNFNFRDIVSGNVLFSLRGSGAAAPYGMANFNTSNSTTESVIAARGVLKYNGNSNTISFSSGIISSVTKNAVGDYTVVIGTRGSDNYVTVCSSRVNSSTKQFIGNTLNTEQVVGSFRINSSDNNGTIGDSNMVMVSIFES